MAPRPTPLLDRLDRIAGSAPVRYAALLVAMLVVYLQAHFFFLAESHEVDSFSYWFAAEAVAQGGNPYDTSELQAAGRRHELRLVATDTRAPDIYPYVYPPPFAGLWRVTLGMRPTTVHRVLEVLGTLALGAVLVLLQRVVAPARHGGLLFVLFALGLAVNGPAVSSTRLGQVNAPLLAAMLVATGAWARGREVRSALALAAATLVKLSPGILLLTWGLASPDRRWLRGVAWFVAASVTLVLVSLPAAPVVHWRQFADTLASGIPWQTEYSWWGWLTVHGRTSPGLLAARLPLYLAGAAFLIGVAWFLLRNVARERRAVEGASVGMVLVLLLSPLTWQHHFLFFLLPAYRWIARAWAEDRRLLTLAFAGLALLVLLRLPGSILVIRPVATLAAFLLAAFAFARDPGREPLSSGS